jgi:hypothetical protein
MLFLPGWFITVLTFPGVIFHEIAHRFFCDIAGVPVYEIRYLRFGNPAGYVIHGEITSSRTAVLVALGPLILNTALCALLTFAAVIPMGILRVEETLILSSILMWLGLSIGMHAFPSTVDMSTFRASVKQIHGDGSVYAKLAVVMVGFFKIINLLRFVWFDGIYAIAISLLVPDLIIGF